MQPRIVFPKIKQQTSAGDLRQIYTWCAWDHTLSGTEVAEPAELHYFLSRVLEHEYHRHQPQARSLKPLPFGTERAFRTSTGEIKTCPIEAMSCIFVIRCDEEDSSVVSGGSCVETFVKDSRCSGQRGAMIAPHVARVVQHHLCIPAHRHHCDLVLAVLQPFRRAATNCIVEVPLPFHIDHDQRCHLEICLEESPTY